MAVTAREVIMVFRGQNYLSSAIRRVGRDVGTLSRTQQLNTQRQAIQLANQRSRIMRANAYLEERSLREGGSRRLGLEKSIAAQQVAQGRAIATQIDAERRLIMMERTFAERGALAGMNSVESQMAIDAQMRRALAATQAVEDHDIALRKLTADEIRQGQILAQLTQKRQLYTAEIQKETAALLRNAEAQRLATRYERWEIWAARVQHAGRVAQMFGLIGAATFGYFAKQAIDFSGQITLAATQSTTATNNTTKQVLKNAAVLQKAVLNMLAAGKTAAQPSELTNALYTVLSGVTLQGGQAAQLKQATSILEQFNKVYTANYGQVEFNDVVKAGIALINNFGLSAKTLPAVLNRMQASVRFGAMNMQDFTGSLNQVVPAFRGAHYSFDQLSADVAFVSRLFPSLRQGTTGLARLTEVFGRFNKQISRDVGQNIAPGGRLLPIDRIVQAIIRAHPQLAKGGVDLQNYFKTVTGTTSTIQSRKAFVGYATQLKLYQTIARQVKGDNNELKKSFMDMSQTPQVRWAEFTNQLRALILLLGSGAVRAFQQFGKPVAWFVRWFNSLGQSTRHTIGYIAAVISILSLLGGTVAIVFGGLAKWFFIWKVYKTLTAEATISNILFARSAGAVRVGLGLGISSLSIGIFLLYKYHGAVDGVVKALGGWQNVLVVLTSSILAFRAALYLTNILGIATALNTATLSAIGLKGALLALGSPEVLIALAAAAAAVAAIDWHKHVRHRVPDSGQIRLGGTSAGELFMRKGQLFLETVHASVGMGGGAGTQITEKAITAEQARKLGFDTRTLENKIIEAQRFNNVAAAISAENKAIVENTKQKVVNRKLDTILGVKDAVKSIPQVIAHINALNKARLADPTDLQKQKEYEQAVDALNKRFKDRPALLAAINDVLGAYNAETKDAIKNTQTLGITFQDVLKGVQGLYNNFKQTETGLFGSLFGGPFINSPTTQNRMQWGGRLTGRDLLRDLHSQVSNFNHFHNRLDNLRKRGAPQELINQLMAAGDDPESMRRLTALQSLKPQQLQEYFRTFQQGQRLIKQATMNDLKNQLSIYRKHGRNIALAIIAGLRDENVGLEKALTKMIKNMFPGLPTAATTGKTTTPPKKEDKKPVTHVKHEKNEYHFHGDVKDKHGVKTAIRHANHAKRSKYYDRGPGPR